MKWNQLVLALGGSLGVLLLVGSSRAGKSEEQKPMPPRIAFPLPPEDTQTPRNTELLVANPEFVTAPGGHPVEIDFQIKNTTDKTLWFTESASTFDYQVRVYKVGQDRDGKTAMVLAPLTEYGRPRLAGPHVIHRFYALPLNSGETKPGRLLVSRLFDMTEAGKYSVSISCYAYPGPGVETYAKRSLLVAAPVVVEVL